MKIRFSKFHGATNDFVIVNDWDLSFPESDGPFIVDDICARRTGIGSEGMIIVRRPRDSSSADYRMVFYNPDGSRAAMCGNGARCVAYFAFKGKIAGMRQRIETDAGIVRAEIIDYDNYAGEGLQATVRIEVPPVSGITYGKVTTSAGEFEYGHINSGVPHAVVFDDQIVSRDVDKIGREIRNSELFRPDGANVDFVKYDEDHDVYRIRTYERGCECETGACGTGAIASAMVINSRCNVGPTVDLVASSGDRLTVDCGDGNGRPVTLTGPAVHVFDGEILYE